MSLFEKMGGNAALDRAVRIFYARMMGDDDLRPFLISVDPELQARKLVGFMGWAFGGPDAYKGRDLRAAHARLVTHMGLNDRHFDRTLGHLEETLTQLEMAPPLVEQALAIIESTRERVLGRA